MRRAPLRGLAFGLGFVLAAEGLRVALAWWRGDEPPGALGVLLVAALPLWALAWWRLSIFGRKAPPCLLPDAARDADPSPDPGARR